MSWRTNPNPTVKPPFGSYIDWSHPLTNGLKACYLFNEFEGTIANDLTKLGSTSAGGNDLDISAVPWVNRPGGRGIYFDNTQNVTTSALGITSPDPGFWHKDLSEFTIHARCTLELDAGGPLTLIDIGGYAYGIYIGYRTTPDTIVFATATAGVAGTYVEIASSTLFTPDASRIIDIIAIFDNGNMSLYIDGILEATGIASIGVVSARSGDPGIGSTDSNNALNIVIDDEWGGTLFDLQLWDKAIKDPEWLAAEPYCFIAWPGRRVIFDFGAAGFILTKPVAWRNFITKANEIAYKILDNATKQSNWAIFNVSSIDDEWRILTSIDRFAAWQILNNSNQSAIWKVTNKQDKNYEWKIINKEQETSNWNILSGLSQGTAWQIITTGLLSSQSTWSIISKISDVAAWTIQTTFSQEDAWKILNNPQQNTAWSITQTDTHDTEYSIQNAAETDTAWTVVTVEASDSAWNILTSNTETSGWIICNDLTQEVVWNVISDNIPEPLKTFVGIGRTFIFSADKRTFIFKKEKR